jgi:hypothetical protein
MEDHNWPLIIFSNLTFFLLFGATAYFLIRSRKDGYWNMSSEDPKYRMLQDDDDSTEQHHAR